MFFAREDKELPKDSHWVDRMRKLKKFVQQHPYTLTHKVYTQNPTSFFSEEEFLSKKPRK